MINALIGIARLVRESGTLCRLAAAVAASAALASGCGPQRAAVYPVSGEVRLAGKPFAKADVTFVPQGGRPALAQTDAQGRFTLRTWTAGDGAVAGEHVVCIVKHDESRPPPTKPGSAADPYAEAMRPNVAPAQYASPVTSPLRATVVPGKDNRFEFDLSVRGPR